MTFEHKVKQIIKRTSVSGDGNSGLAGAAGIAPSGSVTGGAIGNLLLGTVLPAVFSGGLWLYFPAGAISGGVAGLYWVVMTSATVGTVYVTKGGVVAVGGGAYTGVTDEVTLFSVTQRINGSSYLLRSAAATTNSAGSKTTRFRYAGQQLGTVAATAALGQVACFSLDSLSDLLQAYAQASASGTTSVLGFTTVDSTIDQTISITGQVAVATDCYVLVHGSVTRVH